MRFGFRELIFFLLLLAIPVASYFMVFEKRNSEINELKADIDRKQAKLQKLEEVGKQFADLGQEIEKLTEAVAIFEQKLPAEQEVEVMLKEVWELTERHRLTPKSVRTDKVMRTADYAEMPIKMVIVGNFDGYYQFLLDLEKLRRITRMPQMKLKKVDGDREGVMEAEVVMSIFFDASQARADTAK